MNIDTPNHSIRLTETVKKGGCAAKLPAGELRKVLGSLDLPRVPELKVGTEHLDDACLYELGPSSAQDYLVQTLDFFTPIVDDPEDFGAIAAANALSDVYAMGGSPKIALTILAFPASTLSLDLLQPLMRGAIDRIRESGACLAGGHSIDDDTLKLGFSVTGFVNRSQAWTNQGARAGDALILTKALGTGTITTALKLREASQAAELAAIASMKQLNHVRDLIDPITQVHAATDVTGFGLSGHGLQMAQASGVQLEIELSSLPHLPGALDLLSNEYLNQAHKTNEAYAEGKVSFSENFDPALRWLTFDPQTSGGLLLSVPAEKADAVVQALLARFPHATRIGKVVAQDTDSTEPKAWVKYRN